MQKIVKICSKCNIEKDISCFSFRKDRNNYYTVCKDCRKNQRKIWSSNNRDKLNGAAKKWRENNPDQHKEQYKRYQAKESTKNRERKWYIDNKDRILKQSKIWYQNNKHIAFANDAKRRAAKLNATLHGFDNEIRDIYKNRPDGYHVDHIVPLQGENVCGLHVPWNLQYLPASDNLRKGNRV